MFFVLFAQVLDPSFGSNGFTYYNDPFMAAIYETGFVQSDGQIVVGGSMFSLNSGRFFVARYRANGTLDTKFSGDGIFTHDIGAQNSRTRFVLQVGAGKIMALGFAGQKLALARLTPDGELDSSFHSNGYHHIEYGHEIRTINGFVWQDGILLTGYSVPTEGSKQEVFLARFDQDGGLDANFGDGGIATFSISGEDLIGQSIAPSGYGYMVACSSSSDDIQIVHFSLTGSSELFRTFDLGGQDRAFTIKRNNNSYFLVGQKTESGVTEGFLARMDNLGNLAPNFGDGGVFWTSGEGFNREYDVNFQSGWIYLAGTAIKQAGVSGKEYRIRRLFHSGDLDLNFAQDGVFKQNIGNQDIFRKLFFDSNGLALGLGQTHFGSLRDASIHRFLAATPAHQNWPEWTTNSILPFITNTNNE